MKFSSFATLAFLFTGVSANPMGNSRVTNRGSGDCLTVDLTNRVGWIDDETDPTNPTGPIFDVILAECDGSDAQTIYFGGYDFEGSSNGELRAEGLEWLNPKGATEMLTVCLGDYDMGGDLEFVATDCNSVSTTYEVDLTAGTFTTEADSMCLAAAGTDVSLTGCSANTDTDQQWDYTHAVDTANGAGKLNFAVSLRDTNVVLESAGGGTSEITFTYVYGGPAGDFSKFAFPIYAGENDCGAIGDTAEVDYSFNGNSGEGVPQNNEKGLQVTSINYDDSQGLITVKIDIDLTEIEKEDLSNDPPMIPTFWRYNDARTAADLFFCGRLKIFYNAQPNVLIEANPGEENGKGNWVEVNYHETNLIANIDLLEDGGFELKDVSVNLDRGAITEARPDVSIEYPVQVDFCADDGVIINDPPQVITQGFPIQLCVRLQGWPNVQGAYVRDIWSFAYKSRERMSDPTTAIEQHNADVLTEKDCGYDGICRIKWVPLAKYFRTFTTGDRSRANLPVGTSTATFAENGNPLMVNGFATINFGADPDATPPPQQNQAQRKLSTVRGAFATAGRALQQEEGVSIVNESFSSIEPEEPRNNNKSRNSNKQSAATTVVGFVMPALFAVVGFFF